MSETFKTVNSDIGNFYDFIDSQRIHNEYEFSFLSGKWADFEQWKTMARAKVFDLLSYSPGKAPLNPRTTSRIDKGSYLQEEIEFNTSDSLRIKGLLLLPKTGTGPYPAIVALHDHGGFYYYGKEKIVANDHEPEILRRFKESAYKGHSWASDLAQRGYVVFCIDAFYFGSRKLDPALLSADTKARLPFDLQDLADGDSTYIEKFNKNCGSFEGLLVKHILTAGLTWPGILFHDDRISIDYLLTRREADPQRIGCCGLSIGGFRSAHLAALDPRISCSVVVGWMTTYSSLLYNRLRDHTYMIYVPKLTRYLDLPDVVSLSAPNPLLVQQCSRDQLFTPEGMQQACKKIGLIYDRIGQSKKFKCEFYDNTHEFNLLMQENAFRWLDRWLK